LLKYLIHCFSSAIIYLLKICNTGDNGTIMKFWDCSFLLLSVDKSITLLQFVVSL